MSTLELLDSHQEHLGGDEESTYSKRVDTTIFTFAGYPPDQALLSALVGHDQYEPRHADGPDLEHDVSRVPSRSDALTVVNFDEVTRHDAQTVLEQWVLHETTPDLGDLPDQDEQTQLVDSLRSSVFPSFAGDAVYRLAHLGASTPHDDERTLGVDEAHEYVVINRTKRRLTLIAASDD